MYSEFGKPQGQMSQTSRRLRTEGMIQENRVIPISSLTTADSWIDISSQPSSSSLQSNNEIITTGLSIERRSRPQSIALPPSRSTSVAGSSQDEYEESESDSDRVMSSTELEDDRTALAGFTPQPNAFSHPPATTSTTSNPYFPPVSHSDRLPTNRLMSQRSFRREPQDHDAALRASLTTLLSCAAAVRPKERQTIRQSQPSAVQPSTLRLIPESQLDAPKHVKRRSRETSKERHAKKMRAVNKAVSEDMVSPTVMTWMISAGVVLVFSAISFSAGYAWGKEVGQHDMTCSSCGKETIKAGSGLRKLRWSTAQSVST